MKTINYVLVTSLALSLLTCQSSIRLEENKTKLIVLISLDQFRAGYLSRYQETFVGGFKRMMEEGLWYPKAIVDHAPTLSLPGHTTLATGANPCNHGITSNAWLDRDQRPHEDGLIRGVFPHMDPGHKIIGEENARAFSPFKIRVEGLADWVRQSNPNAKIVALSVTPLSVLYGGKAALKSEDNHVYWLGSTGKFISSTYYRDDYPDWIHEFNEGMEEKYIQHHIWENTVPFQFQHLARPDAAEYEHDGVHTTFPHLAEDEISDTSQAQYNRWFGRYSPYQNEALFDLAKVAVQEQELGQRGSVDFLALAVKLTDRIGHDFGPRSLEQLDVILRLDRLIGDFFKFLDEELGADNYTVAISADHGSPNISEYEISQGRAATRIQSEDVEKALQSIDSLVTNYSGKKEQLPNLIAKRLQVFPFVSKTMTREQLLDKELVDPYLHVYRNSFIEEQATTYPLWTTENRYGNLVSPTHPANYGIMVDVAYKANIWSASATHGGAHDYDKEIPILLMGPDVPQGIAREQAFSRDIAPTLASLAGLEIPETVDGKVLRLYTQNSEESPTFAMNKVVIRTIDAEELATWYTDHLQFSSFESTNSENQLLRKGDFLLELVEDAQAISPDSLEFEYGMNTLAGFYKFGFAVNQLDSLFQWVKTKGLSTAGGILKGGTLGARSFIVIDPQGNYIQFFEKKGVFENFNQETDWKAAFYMIISNDYGRSMEWYAHYGFKEVANNDNPERGIFQRSLFNGHVLIELADIKNKVASKTDYPNMLTKLTGVVSIGAVFSNEKGRYLLDDSGNVLENVSSNLNLNDNLNDNLNLNLNSNFK